MNGRTPLGDEPAVAASTARWQLAGVVVVILLIVAFPLYMTVDDARRVRADAERQDALVALGTRIWSLNCAECHGVMGQGIDAPALNSQQFLKTASDLQIHRLTSVGYRGPRCPHGGTRSVGR